MTQYETNDHQDQFEYDLIKNMNSHYKINLYQTHLFHIPFRAFTGFHSDIRAPIQKPLRDHQVRVGHYY